MSNCVGSGSFCNTIREKKSTMFIIFFHNSTFPSIWSHVLQIKFLLLLEDSFETSVAALEIPEANGSTSLVSLKSLKADELPSSKKDRMTFYLKKIQSNLRSENMKNKEYYNISHHF